MFPFESAAMTNFSWWSWAPESMDIRRVIQLEGRYVSLSPFGIKVHKAEAPYLTERTLKYDDAQEECGRLLKPGSAPW
jgi:hypothetical protein